MSVDEAISTTPSTPGEPPAPPAPGGSVAGAEQTTPPNSLLMKYVIWILGLTLLLLVAFLGAATLSGKNTNDLNTLTSLIAGGFIGFLTPHVAVSARSRGVQRSKSPRA
jgi:hypothetical protein